MNKLLNKFQGHVFIYRILINFEKKGYMLKFEFFKQFHVEDNKIKLFKNLLKDLKWFGGEDLGASP